MQKITIIGNIGRDAELKEINSQFLIQFTVAVNTGYYDQNRNWVDRTNWYNCKIWKDKNQKTDIVKKLNKGRKIYVEGSPDISIYKDKDGQSRIDLGMRVTTFELLDTLKKEETNNADNTNSNSQTLQPQTENTNNNGGIDDDLPF